MKNLFKISIGLVLFGLTMIITYKTQAQIDLQTGSAVFSIPIFNWQDNESRLNTDIALNYNSGNGLRVSDVASDIGQGWNLEAGGMITRMQVGEPDDQQAYHNPNDPIEKDNDLSKYPSGFLYSSISPAHGCPYALARYPIYKAQNVLYKEHNIVASDRQLDYFTFQFNGKTGLFVIDYANGGSGWSLGDTKMKISFHTDPSMATGDTNGIRTTITSFSIQDVDGLIYKFSVHGMTKVLTEDYCNKDKVGPIKQPKFKDHHVYYQTGFTDSTHIVNPWIINSWYLSEIEDPLTGRTVQYTYSSPVRLDNNAGQDITYNDASKDYVIVSYKRSVTKTPIINTISYPDGHSVNFNYQSAQRADFPGRYPLASIDVKYQGRYLSEYQLRTSYFILTHYGIPSTKDEKSVARLCLKAVKRIGVDLKDDAPAYMFDYYLGGSDDDDFVPPPFFYAKDIWGYYNGDSSLAFDKSGIPLNTTVSLLNFNQLKGLCFLRQNDNGPVLNQKLGYAKNGLLRQVIYPTGGTLTYQYTQNSGKLTTGGSDIAVGGVHVSETSSTDGGFQNNCANPLVTHYNYVLDESGSPSSLWGLEQPQNFNTIHTHYNPEVKKFRFVTLSCHWIYQYPGILSQTQAVSISALQQITTALAPALGVISMVTDVLDVLTYASIGTGLGYVIMDVITTIVGVALTCIGDNSHGYTNNTYYNKDLNEISPLPRQFKRVEIVQGDGSDGKTVETFTSDDDYPIWVPPGGNPYFSAKQRFASWAYGMPKVISIYDANNHLVKQTENRYDLTLIKQCIVPPDSDAYYERESLPVGCESSLTSCNCQVLKTSSQRNDQWSKPSVTPGDGGFDDTASYYNDSNLPTDGSMNIDFYGMYTGRINLDTTYERNYSTVNPSQYEETVTSYTYDPNNYEVQSTSTKQSNGDINIKDFTYTGDFLNFAVFNANNVIALPVQTATYVIKSGQQSRILLESQVTEYEQLSNGDIKPSNILEERFDKPDPNANGIYGGPGSDVSQYKKIQSFTYDGNGNIIGIEDEGLRNVTNIYGYNNKYIIATVINANPLVDKTAYCSFEDDGWGGWTMQGTPTYVTTASVTGNRSLSLSSGKSISASISNTEAYTVSFWSTHSLSVSGSATVQKSAPTYNGFTYYEYSIPQGSTSITISGTGNLDELRIYPEKARMKTTTYDPLIGKTSKCDENNRITYYEYDSLGRLQFVKDDQRKTLKMYEYNNVSVARQNGCPGTYYNHPISEVFTQSNCAVGTVPDTTLHPYTIPANKYSSTISQEDADAQAELELLTYGQAMANAHSCITIYYNTELKDTEYTQTCNPGYDGGPVTYTVPAHRYYSTISQADADEQAADEIDANAQTYANMPENAACVYSTTPDWEGSDSAAYCSPVNGVGHLFVLMTDENPNSPTYNQSQYKDIGPQDECPACTPSFTYSSAVSSYTENEISVSDTMVYYSLIFTYPSSGIGSFTLGGISGICCLPTSTRTIPYAQGANTFNLIISPNGQVTVQVVSGPPPAGVVINFSGSYDLNMNAYYSAAYNELFTTSCPSGQTGSTVQYSVPAYTYRSFVSQQDANQQAVDDAAEHGQNYANQNGTCSVSCSFTPASGITFYTSTVGTSGTTTNFDFVFPSPSSSYYGGIIGTINGGCVPSGVRSNTVTDPSSNTIWNVVVHPSGTVEVTWIDGTIPGTGSTIHIAGSYTQ